MKVIYKYQEINSDCGRGIALGNFDGIHIGHQKLIQILLNKSKSKNLQSCVYTFMNHTIPIITNKNSLQYITSLETKKAILADYGIDILFLDEFNKKLMSLSPKDFVENILVKTLNCKEAIVGFDYRFGHKAEGDIFLLQKLGEIYGFEVTVIDAVKIKNEKVSSSTIRKYLIDGNIEKANVFLGRYFSLHNKVIHGDSRGRKLGYPTANINIDPLQLLPKPGVYATVVKIDNNTYMGATFIGSKQTFELNTLAIETYIIDFDENLYDKSIDIYFAIKIRDEKKFKSVGELISQINTDVKMIKKHLQPNVNMLK